MNTFVNTKAKKKNFENLTQEEKDWLKHCQTGQIRNLLANEFKIERGKTSGEVVQNFLIKDFPKVCREALQSEMDKLFDQQVDSPMTKMMMKVVQEEFRKAVQKQVAEHLKPRIQEAAENMTMRIGMDFDTYEAKTDYTGVGPQF